MFSGKKNSVVSKIIFGRFLPKFWALFEKVAGRTLKWVAGHTPNSPDIFFDIERVSRAILDVWRASNSFTVNILIFFILIFVSTFFLWENPAKMKENFGWIYNGILFSFQKEESNISILCKFQIHVEQSILVAEKLLP